MPIKGEIRELKNPSYKVGEYLNGYLIKKLYSRYNGSGWDTRGVFVCPICKQDFDRSLSGIKSGKTKSCGHCTEVTLIGKKFNNIFVKSFAYRDDHGTPHFNCVCDCGNELIVSYTNLKYIKTCGRCNARLEIGKEYGVLEVIEFDHYDEKGCGFFKCRCKTCGEIDIYRISNLKSNTHDECKHCLENSEIGNSYGYLTIKKYVGKDKHGNKLFLCECRCGDQDIYRLADLRSGNTTSCGCIYSSIGELNIKKILEDNNINFIWQYSFNNCKDKLPLPFDFYIDNSYLIEFDGIQHIKTSAHWGGDNSLKTTQLHDKIKNDYCISNNIPLIRIPHTKRDSITIEDLIPETSQFLIN